MANKIAQGLTAAGVEVKLYDVAESDRTEIITQMLSAKDFFLVLLLMTMICCRILPHS